MQVGDAHWFNIADLTAGVADGTIKGYYEGMQNDMLDGGKDADLVMLSDDDRVDMVFTGGRLLEG